MSNWTSIDSQAQPCTNQRQSSLASTKFKTITFTSLDKDMTYIFLSFGRFSSSSADFSCPVSQSIDTKTVALNFMNLTVNNSILSAPNSKVTTYFEIP